MFLRNDSKEMEVAKVWLNRSGTAPITFIICGLSLWDPPVDSDLSEAILGIMASHCARWQRMTLLAAPIISVTILDQIIGNLPLLESLELDLHANGQPRLWTAFREAPRLRSLRIEGISHIPSISLPWHQLTSLTVTIGVGDCLEMLQQTPNLVTLNVPFPLHSERASGNVPQIQLDFLTTLDIDNENGELLGPFFDHLTLPSLSRFDLRGHLGDSPPIIASMLARSSTLKPLVQLAMEGRSVLPHHPPWHLQILEAVPHVESLTVVKREGSVNAVDELFEALTISSDRCLVPKMQTFDYTPEWPRGIGNGEALVNMIESRRRIDKGGAISQLLSVHVECPWFELSEKDVTVSAFARLQKFSREKLFSINTS
ncbi:hypothetical protein HWV62_9175 [Athelia sp. TMB]|nr:hypothetical protein HWV62_9175 [Athelia sp. TMB]